LVPARLFIQFLFITMHLGFLLFLGVGQFPWISITSLLAFTPSAVWDELARRVRTPERLAIRIYYDKPCNFCKKISLILRSFLLFFDTPVEPAQQTPKIHAILEKHNSWVVMDAAEKAHVRWDAMITLFSQSPLFGWLTPILTLEPLRNLGERFYSWVAANRESLADQTAPWLVMRNQSTQPSWVTSNVVLFFLVIMVLANITYVNGKPMPALVEKALRSLDLYQPWVMFIQTPPARAWYLARGITKEGDIVDVYRNQKGEPSPLAPKHAVEGGWDPNYRWRKFLINLWYPSLHHLRPYYAAYLCRRWNSTHREGDRLVKITVSYAVGGGPLNHPIDQYPWDEFQCELA
jgi:predicted DCC family thiol-disulfide oxidoreductase YuxK